MDIELAAVADAGAVADCWVSLADEQRQYGSHVLGGENREHVREVVTRHAATERLLVARSDGIAGFAMFTLERGTYRKDVDRGVVESLYVVPERRNEGIGTALLEATERRLRAEGADTIVLETVADNEAARRFYRRHGYEPHRIEMEKQSDNHSKERG